MRARGRLRVCALIGRVSWLGVAGVAFDAVDDFAGHADGVGDGGHFGGGIGWCGGEFACGEKGGANGDDAGLAIFIHGGKLQVLIGGKRERRIARSVGAGEQRSS
jgi:hypothetical protein